MSLSLSEAPVCEYTYGSKQVFLLVFGLVM
jgi:hypothetical protein